MGLLTEMTPYRDVNLKVRMKILRVSGLAIQVSVSSSFFSVFFLTLKCLCEEQFDCNVNLRNVLKRETPGMLIKPVGVDRNGVRYWLLQVSYVSMDIPTQ